eukprot:19743-Heterococcus_DN1.PRE.3
MAVSHDGRLLLVIDDDGRALLVNLQRRVVLHRLNFKHRVRAAAFSPSDGFIAVAVGKSVQVWRTPGRRHQFSPLVLHKTYGGQSDDITCLDWAPDDCHLLAGSRDMTARVYYINDAGYNKGFVPTTLSGHRDVLRGVHFGESPGTCYTVAKDGAVFAWEFESDKPGSKAAAVFSPAYGKWKLKSKHFLRPAANTACAVASCAFARSKGLLVIGFTTGVFGLYEMPSGAVVHTLSVGQKGISSAAIAPQGEWLAFGCAAFGQLLVWEWQSETYVLKQAGHNYGLNTLAFSPNGALCATGGEDNKESHLSLKAAIMLCGAVPAVPQAV